MELLLERCGFVACVGTLNALKKYVSDERITSLGIKHHVVQVALWPVQLEVSLNEGRAIFVVPMLPGAPRSRHSKIGISQVYHYLRQKRHWIVVLVADATFSRCVCAQTQLAESNSRGRIIHGESNPVSS